MPTPEEMQASINRIEADLAALRQAKGSGYLAGFPKWVVILFAVWVVAIETAEKLPQIMLSYPRYEATLAETQAKLMQPDLVRAQLTKAENEAKASALQPDLLKAQLDRAVSDATTAKFAAAAAPNQPRLVAAQADKAVLDAEAAKLQPDLMVATLEKARNDAKTSAIQPALTALNLAKTAFETQAAVYQPKLNEVQLAKLGVETKTAVYQQGLTAANAVQAEQQTAMSNAALAVMAPMVGSMLKQFGIDIPMDKIAPMLGVIDPAARTRDLQSAMPVNAQPDTQTASADYRNGAQSRDNWESWTAGLTGDAAEGAQFWAGVRSEKKPHTCTEQKGATSQAFRNACEEAKRILTIVDRGRKTSADYLAGWNSR